MDIAELIAELEKAPRPSRELDVGIAVAVRAIHESAGPYCGASISGGEVILEYRGITHRGIYDLGQIPHYTSSVDSALTLVPEGWWVHRAEERTGHWEWTLTDSEEHALGDAATPALALCIAALRARTEK